jgi:dTDP-glucose pyrophosphorylase
MINWTKTILPLDSTVGEAVKNLNDSGARIVLVTDSDSTLIGIVVDGDIRRGMLKGVSLSDQVEKVINHDAKTVNPEVSEFDAVKLMELWSVSHLPVIDEAGKVCGLHSIIDVAGNANRTNLFVIMAGGYGRRMGEATTKIPKPMLEVAGRPMLEYLVLRAKKSGFVKFAISIHHQGEVIEDYFGDGSSLGVQISYLRENRPLGTAGSLALIDPVASEPVVVSNADLVSSINFGALLDYHVGQGNDATMAVRDYELQNPFGVVSISDGKIDKIIEKPVVVSKISAGIYVLDPTVIAMIPQEQSLDMPNVLQNAISRNLVVAPFQLHEDWLDVGQPSDLRAAEEGIGKL